MDFKRNPKCKKKQWGGPPKSIPDPYPNMQPGRPQEKGGKRVRTRPHAFNMERVLSGPADCIFFAVTDVI